MRLVLLHGLSRVREAMGPLGGALRAAGHEVHLVHYASREGRLAAHALGVAAKLDAVGLGAGGPDLGFVAHSLGGLVLRALAAHRPSLGYTHAVVFGAPMTGSVLARVMRRFAWVRDLVGPAIDDLTPESVAKLPPVPARVLSIAGTTAHPLVPTTHLLRFLARGRRSDSLVLVDETRVAGAEHVELPEVHFTMPRSPAVHRTVAAFLRG